MKKFLIALLGTAALGVNIVNAHGNMKPEHGGVVQMVGETVFELVVMNDRAEVYLREEDEPLPSAGMSGKLVVTINGVKSESALVAASNNKLEAKHLNIPVGARVAVQIVRKDQSKLNASFTIK